MQPREAAILCPDFCLPQGMYYRYTRVLRVKEDTDMTKNELVILFFFLLLAGVGARSDDRDHGDECLPTRCRDEGPEIRYPFWLKDHQPDRCGYGPDFALTCSPSNNETLLDSPFSVKVVVEEINYYCQSVWYELSSDYAPHQKNLSLIFDTSPFSPFQLLSNIVPEYGNPSCRLYSEYPYDALCESSIFSCLSSLEDHYNIYEYTPLQCLSRQGQNLYLLKSDYLIRQNLLNCKKMDTIPCLNLYLPPYNFDCSRGRSRWSEPSCRKCGEERKYCRMSSSNNSKKHETECFGTIPQTDITNYHMPPRGEKKSPLVKGLIPPAVFLLVVFAIATYFAHRSNILKKEDQLKVERFLENYRALKPTRYTYAEIKKITHNLKDKLGQGGYGTVFKGELSNEVPIAAKILNNFTGNGDDFINEVGTIGTIHHVNVVRLVGYCADGYKKALVYEYMPNDCLEKVISSDHKKASLGWEKLQDIALGIAKGIDYLHQGCDQRILHFDIKPHNILLDKNFIPKISDFGLAKLCSKEQSIVSMTAARGKVGYIAPEVFSRNFGNVSHKSDVYSFGMLLLEMVGGRKKNIDVCAEENSGEVYFPEWIYNRLNREEVNNNEVEEGGDAKIVKKLTIVGLWCIQWYPGDRPSMKAVVQVLEGDGKTLAMPPNPRIPLVPPVSQFQGETWAEGILAVC
ncbi:hypothetical protein RHSIM_Rhsim06G0120400 [Rhododendron simsii]|uniref:Protein kinase domain-containing protein n=1 Tax=Rhododendron simsii TaxID=118357 RepID=A0A834GVX5_RHOSS|nr:hypothetical protein RHSIM_Rhsim06G0120400 [Rhododendron simsii]